MLDLSYAPPAQKGLTVADSTYLYATSLSLSLSLSLTHTHTHTHTHTSGVSST